MRNRLLGATALIGAGMLTATGAGAQSSGGPIELGVSGNMYGFFSVVSQSKGVGPDGISGTADDAPGANRRTNGLARRGRIHFTGSTNLDNGLQVGVQVRLNAVDCRDQIDQSYVWFNSGLGRLEFGKTEAVGAKMFVGAPNPVPNLGLNSPNLLVVNQTNTAGQGTLAATPVTIVYTGKLERLNYFTPRFYGIQLGASYTPVQCAEGNAGSRPCGGSYGGMPQSNLPRGYDYLEGAANFVQKFGDVDVGIYGAYVTTSNGDGVRRVVGVDGTGELQQWGISGEIGYQGLKLGGGFRRSIDDGFNPDRNANDWNIGLTYRSGAWMGGVQYANKKTTFLNREDQFDGVSVGGSYTLGPGIQLIAGVQYYDWSTNSQVPAVQSFATNKAWSASLGTQVNF